MKEARAVGGTDLSLPLYFALQKDPSVNIRPFDRIIYFSDNECNSSWNGLYKTVQGQANKYRRKYNPNFWVHGVDLQGYGTQQFCGERFNLIAGWSDTVLPFINMAEKGFGTLVKTIEAYEVKCPRAKPREWSKRKNKAARRARKPAGLFFGVTPGR